MLTPVLLQIGIVLCLFTDACEVSMPWKYDGFGGECKQLTAYGMNELCITSVGKVGAPDGAMKEGVACKKHISTKGVEAHAASRVPRSGNALYGLAA